MRFRADAIAVACVVALLTVSPSAQQTPAPDTIDENQVAEALAAVSSDPNLGGERTMTMLRWREQQRKPSSNVGWLAWVAGLFGWLMTSARYLVWVGVAVLAGWLAVYVWRALRSSDTAREPADAFVPPTHVRNLDIRPESLPPNVGAAAKKLWDRGDHRDALSLLYRGLLSRLTHVHRVPIVDSSTEGDCLVLLSGRVPSSTGEYATRLVDAWQTFVYGGADTPELAVYALCDGFAGALDRSVERTRAGGGES
jgi:hypothetical protein